MKFLCVECDCRMDFAQRDVPGDGTLAAVFECPGCGRAVAMLTNPMETELVSSLGVKIGGREVPPEEPMESTREMVADPREDAFAPGGTEEPASSGARGAPRDDAAGDGSDAAGPRAPDARRGDAGAGEAGAVEWSAAAERRLDRVPSFVRGMVHRIYTDWAAERDIEVVTPDVMDRARSDLGLEGM